MSEARKIVLRLLAEGKVTVDEAEGLLNSIREKDDIGNEKPEGVNDFSAQDSGEKEDVPEEPGCVKRQELCPETDEHSSPEGDEGKGEGLVPEEEDALADGEDSVSIAIMPEENEPEKRDGFIEYKRETLDEKGKKGSAFNLPHIFRNLGLSSLFKGVQHEKEFTGVLNRDVELWSMKFNSFDGDVKVGAWNEPFYKVIVKVGVKGGREQAEAQSLVESRISVKAEDGIICVKGLDEDFVSGASVEAYFPKSFRYNVEVIESSGCVSLEDMNANVVNVNTSNGKVYINGVNALTVDAVTSSGAMFISADASIIRGNVINGSIRAAVNGTKPGRISLNANRGNVKMMLGDSLNLGYEVKCETKAGEVRVSGNGISKSNQKNLSGSKKLVVRTDSFDPKRDNLMIEAKSIYGFIFIDSERPLILARK